MTKRMKAFKQMCKENEKAFTESMLGTDAKKEQWDEQSQKCLEFIEKLSDILKDRYELIGSCNKDMSRYLIPKGTAGEVTYYGKPAMSFRTSDHWNWYTSLKKCKNPDYIQCNSVDLPRAPKRREEGVPTRPIRAFHVAIQLKDGNYHHVFGEKYDPKRRSWTWIENTPEDICHKYGLI